MSAYLSSSDQVGWRIQELGIELPAAPAANAHYVPCVRHGNLLFLAGHLPVLNDGSIITGRLGVHGVTVQDGQAAARQVGLNLIATLSAHLPGKLDSVAQIVKLFGIVCCADDFTEQHVVMNGCSDVFAEVFGPEVGLHARSAIGTNALPLGVMVEVEAIVRVHDE